jgi:hypothetical protein
MKMWLFAKSVFASAKQLHTFWQVGLSKVILSTISRNFSYIVIDSWGNEADNGSINTLHQNRIFKVVCM